VCVCVCVVDLNRTLGLPDRYAPPFDAACGSKFTSGMWLGSGLISNWDIAYGKEGRVIDR